MILNAAEIGAAIRQYLIETGRIEDKPSIFKWYTVFDKGSVVISGHLMETMEIIIDNVRTEEARDDGQG